MDGPALRIPRDVAAQLMAHARAELPNEACGLLSGSLQPPRVTAFHPAANRHRSPLRFDVDERDLVRFVMAIEQAGDQLAAIFHSHVSSPAVPSATDIREAMYPEAMHLLASLVEPDGAAADALRAWRIRDGRAVELPLEIT
ncbi:MAG TPA: M67 family metallopeptidase [Candidatus Limnocylindria bacterium]